MAKFFNGDYGCLLEMNTAFLNNLVFPISKNWKCCLSSKNVLQGRT